MKASTLTALLNSDGVLQKKIYFPEFLAQKISEQEQNNAQKKKNEEVSHALYFRIQQIYSNTLSNFMENIQILSESHLKKLNKKSYTQADELNYKSNLRNSLAFFLITVETIIDGENDFTKDINKALQLLDQDINYAIKFIFSTLSTETYRIHLLRSENIISPEFK